MNGINMVVAAMLGVIMIARLYAMYQRSRNMLIFLVIIFLAVNIACGVLAVMTLKDSAGGSTIGDCFRVLIKSHVLYFASFVCVSCLQLVGDLSPGLTSSYFVGVETFYGVLQIIFSVQMFVLGPRLIFSIREYHAKLVANSDADISMTSIVFQERVHVPTSSVV
ncbi:uncharacterized protein BJ212DRAFT_869319 [Suillus subaureus]|uniref:Uncharacterized protein n=1 Tax=Suillus subaureus TaxID=48587 RepID=A0A9P7ALR0_9AGAM|nr:uncharacterized protein BJ212DRAFT_869319 [Suillus subaureus]KAG1791967.1 hypothetical protein BJ212DRAFT_869319 [Suillus subaureus]